MHEGKEIPLALHITTAKLSSEEIIRCNELFEQLHQQLHQAKEEGKIK